MLLVYLRYRSKGRMMSLYTEKDRLLEVKSWTTVRFIPVLSVTTSVELSKQL